MTKSQELAALDQFIAGLPADTYLGPWLRQVRGEVERMIRCDIFPDVSLSESADYVRERRTAADLFEKEAKARIAQLEESILSQARASAESILASAESNASTTRRLLENSIRNLRRALDELG